MNKYKYVLFDFNGTLLDDIDMNIEIEKVLMSERNITGDTSKEFYLDNFGFPIIEFYKKLGFDFEKEAYSSVAKEYADEYSNRLNEASIFPDAFSLLQKLNENNIKCVIISATEQSVLSKQAEHYKISQYFEAVLGTGNNLGRSKVSAALDWFSSCGIKPFEAIFVGDTIHDFETAQAIGCDCVLVSRGHNSFERLKSTGCPVFSSLADMLETVFSQVI